MIAGCLLVVVRGVMGGVWCLECGFLRGATGFTVLCGIAGLLSGKEKGVGGGARFGPCVPTRGVAPRLAIASIVVKYVLTIVFNTTGTCLNLHINVAMSTSVPTTIVSVNIVHIVLHEGSVLRDGVIRAVNSTNRSLTTNTVFAVPTLFL